MGDFDLIHSRWLFIKHSFLIHPFKPEFLHSFIFILFTTVLTHNWTPSLLKAIKRFLFYFIYLQLFKFKVVHPCNSNIQFIYSTILFYKIVLKDSNLILNIFKSFLNQRFYKLFSCLNLSSQLSFSISIYPSLEYIQYPFSHLNPSFSKLRGIVRLQQM